MKSYLTFLIGIIIFTSCQSVQEKPNILLFIADDMNFRDCQPYGNSEVKTPNIQKLADEGICLDHMYTATAMCSPTRQQLYTGLFPVRSGAYPNHSRVYPNVKSLGHHFKALGYRVGLVGKKHYGPPEAYPFQYFGGRHHDDGDGMDIDLSKIKPFIAQDNEQPFFIIVSENQPHRPWNRGNPEIYSKKNISVPDYYIDSDETREALIKYYAEITYADSLLGLSMDMLEETGKEANTITIFTSEQGPQFPFGKWTCYDQGLRTAFIVRWPDKIKEGTRSNALTQYVDMVPTLIEAAGEDPEAVDVGITNTKGSRGFDGKSFYPVLLGKTQEHRQYVYGIQTTRGIHYGSACYPIRSIRSEKYKYIWNINDGSPFYNMTTANDNSLYYHWLEVTEDDPDLHQWVNMYKTRPMEELYDMEMDIYERNNLANDQDYAVIKEQLRSELISWMQLQGDRGGITEMKALERQERQGSWEPYGGKPCR